MAGNALSIDNTSKIKKMERQYITINGKDGEYTGYYDTVFPIGCDPVTIEQVHCISFYDGDTMRIDFEEAIRRGLNPFKSETL